MWENRRARHDYEILETFEAGIVLKGSEVKALRSGQIDFTGSFARFEGGELWLENLYISPYEKATYDAPDPRRSRKLLMHRREINKLAATTAQKGLTLIPLKIYFNNHGQAKVLVGLARGRRDYQKKAEDKRKAVQREMEQW